jgi:hypothetical protein
VPLLILSFDRTYTLIDREEMGLLLGMSGSMPLLLLLLCFALVEKRTLAQIVSGADYYTNFEKFSAFDVEQCQALLDVSKDSLDAATGKRIVQAAGASFPAR